MIKLISIVWLVLLGLAMRVVTERISPLARHRHQLVEMVPLARLDTRLLNIITLGYRGLYDDFALLFSLQMLVNSNLAALTTGPQIAYTISQLTRHQPRIESLYMITCFVLTFDLRMPELCEPITLDGMKAMPESWRVPVTQAFISAEFLKDSAKAAIYYGVAASRPQAPEFLAPLTRNLIDKQELSPGDLSETLRKLIGDKQRSRFDEILSPRRQAP